MNNKSRLMEILNDMAQLATIKKMKCLPIYLAGGSACIVGNYIDRMTMDIDIIDLEYPAKMLHVFNVLGQYDLLDVYVTSIADGYEARAIKVKEIENIEVYVLSREDLIVTKLGRYSEKDREDISKLIEKTDKVLLNVLINNVAEKEGFGKKVKTEFIKNSKKFRGEYNV